MDGPFDKTIFDFTEEQRSRLEKALRKTDGKKRLVKNRRKGVFEHLLLNKWKVNTDDIQYIRFEELVRKNANYWFHMDEKAMYYFCKYGWANSGNLIWCWYERNCKWITKLTLKQLMNGG